MKRLFSILTLLIISLSVNAQTQQGSQFQRTISKPLEYYWGSGSQNNTTRPWISISAANSGIPFPARYPGLTIAIGSDTSSFQEYWYYGGRNNNNLIVKNVSSGGVSKGYVDSADANKVDIVAGKQLSKNDFTDVLLSKLNGIMNSATANSTDATLLNRSNHTGTQAQSTIVGLVDSIAALRSSSTTGISTSFNTLSFSSNVTIAHNSASPNWRLSLAGNTTITVSGSHDGDIGLGQIVEDANGGDSVALVGEVETGKSIGRGKNQTTLAGYVNIAGTVYWTLTPYRSIDTGGGGGGGATLITPSMITFVNGAATDNNILFSPGDLASAPDLSDAIGYVTSKISASATPAFIYSKYNSSFASCYFGFNQGAPTGSSPSASGQSIKAGYVLVGPTTSYLQDGGIIASPVTFTNGRWYGVRRSASNVFTLEESTDETTWNVIYTYTYTASNTMNVWICWSSSGGSNYCVLPQPKYIGLQ